LTLEAENESSIFSSLLFEISAEVELLVDYTNQYQRLNMKITGKLQTGSAPIRSFSGNLGDLTGSLSVRNRTVPLVEVKVEGLKKCLD
jgi:hypothetical protein